MQSKSSFLVDFDVVLLLCMFGSANCACAEPKRAEMAHASCRCSAYSASASAAAVATRPRKAGRAGLQSRFAKLSLFSLHIFRSKFLTLLPPSKQQFKFHYYYLTKKNFNSKWQRWAIENLWMLEMDLTSKAWSELKIFVPDREDVKRWRPLIPGKPWREVERAKVISMWPKYLDIQAEDCPGLLRRLGKLLLWIFGL